MRFPRERPVLARPVGAGSATSLTTRQSRRTNRAIALDRLLGPLHVLIRGPEEEDAEPHGVGAVPLDDAVGPGAVPERFEIFVFPLVTQPLE